MTAPSVSLAGWLRAIASSEAYTAARYETLPHHEFERWKGLSHRSREARFLEIADELDRLTAENERLTQGADQ